MTDGITLRAVRPRDLAERMADLDFRAFRAASVADWVKYFREHTALARRDSGLVIERDGELLAQCVTQSLELSLAGQAVAFGGVAAVGVAPEARRQGLADRLLREALRRMHAARLPYSLLYPFSVRYYRRFGYAVAEWIEEFDGAPSQLRDFPERLGVRRLDPARHAAAIRRVYEGVRARKDRNGTFTRDAYWWRARVFDRTPDWLGWYDAEGSLQGVLGYQVPDDPTVPHQRLVVRELMYTSPASLRGLVGALAAQGEQLARIELQLPRGLLLHLLADDGRKLEEPAAYHAAGRAAVGAMARVVDVPRAFELHPGPRASRLTGACGVDVIDPVLGDARFDVTVGTRGARALPGRQQRRRLALGPGELAQVLLGACHARELLAAGSAAGHADAAALLDRAFPAPPLFLGRSNYF